MGTQESAGLHHTGSFQAAAVGPRRCLRSRVNRSIVIDFVIPLLMDGFDGTFELVPLNKRHVGVDDFAVIATEALFTDLDRIV